MLLGETPFEMKFFQLDYRGTNEFLVWGTATNWEITNAYPLSQGPNSITVIGLDRLGSELARTTNTITRQ